MPPNPDGENRSVIKWKRSDADAATDLTDAIEDRLVSATPQPNEAVDRPTGCTVNLTLKSKSESFANEL